MRRQTRQPATQEQLVEYLQSKDETQEDFIRVCKNRVTKKAKKLGIIVQYGGLEITYYLDKMYITEVDFDSIDVGDI